MKKLWAVFLCFILFICIGNQTALAEGDGNMDGGGGGMGSGTSEDYWNGGEDGVRITVIRSSNASAASIPVDFRNKSYTVVHFGKVSKLDYCEGKELKPSGSSYVSIIPNRTIPRIVSGSGGSICHRLESVSKIHRKSRRNLDVKRWRC